MRHITRTRLLLAALVIGVAVAVPSIAGLASAGIAATYYASNCTDDSPLFVVTWYPLAAGIVALVGAAAGSRLLRW